MNKLRGRQTDTLTVGNDQMLFALPVEVDGVEETLFTTKEMQSNTSITTRLRQKLHVTLNIRYGCMIQKHTWHHH